ncbi:MAG TPA: RsmE family RNA methyltransferase [Bdellovibrionota bacterium]|jgi:16S rRNA (uracil1498-N3)-methyltransferase
MRRFLVGEKLKEGASLCLSADETKHATRVMRLKAGDKILLTDGKGTEAEAEILSCEKTGAQLRVLSLQKAKARNFRVELIQGTLKGARMDWLIEKATELGVDAVHVVDTEFAVAGERADRWSRLAQAAVKQSGNPRLPEIHTAKDLAEALSRLPKGFQGLLLSPHAKQGLLQTMAMARRPEIIVLAVGPEGGFSSEEEHFLTENRFTPCLLSSQILRGETAALTAVALSLHALEFPGGSGL